MSFTIEHASFNVPDISCGHCVTTIERGFENLPGVRNVAADATTKRVEVDFDPDRINRDRIVSTLDALGYPVAHDAQ